MAAHRRDQAPLRAADVDLRGPPRLLAPEHARGGNRSLTYRELADELSAYVKDMGFTHVELLPVMEHPFERLLGLPGDRLLRADRRYGSPDDFRYFVDRLHANGIGVIIDWVPAHFPRDDFALGRFDGTALYEHADPRHGEHPGLGHATSSTSAATRSATS